MDRSGVRGQNCPDGWSKTLMRRKGSKSEGLLCQCLSPPCRTSLPSPKADSCRVLPLQPPPLAPSGRISPLWPPTTSLVSDHPGVTNNEGPVARRELPGRKSVQRPMNRQRRALRQQNKRHLDGIPPALPCRPACLPACLPA